MKEKTNLITSQPLSPELPILKNNKVNNDAREKNNMQLFILVGVLLLVVGGYSALKLL